MPEMSKQPTSWAVPHETSGAAFEREQRGIIEQIATGVPLGVILEHIVLLIEAQADGMTCSILLLDREGGCVRHGAAPHLPAAFVAAIDDQPIGPAAGSCGTAAFLGERVIVEDIASHPYWAKYRAAALPHGLRACWSSPIFSIDRKVLGTFAMYYREARGPAEHERVWVDRATHLAAIAIERDRASTRLRAQSLRIAEQAALLDQATDAIFVCDLAGIVRYWNRGAERLYGWTRAEALGRPAGALVEGSDPLRDEAERQVNERGAWTGELKQLTKAGASLEIEARWTLLRDAQGNPASVLRINTDVTERNRLQRHILGAQRMDSLGTLAGGIAHDFNNILASLTANASFALDALPRGHAAREFVDEIVRASERATELVRRILAFGRRQEPRTELLQPAVIASEVHQLLRASLPATVDLRLTIGEGVPTIAADPIQVHQVLMNLGTNAAQALRDGHGRVELRVERCVLEAPLVTPTIALPAGTYARLLVIDDGIGMDAATVDRAFEPFFTTKGLAGTGLGLAVVDSIAKNHGGGVTVESAPGAGSTFAVYFPAERNGKTGAAARPLRSAEAQGNGRRVLCIDDEPAIVKVTLLRLERLGYVVTGASDARLALANFKAAPDAVDILLTDYRMPGLMGIDLVLAFRAVRPELPIVLTSGLIEDDAARRLDELGVQIVPKPASTEALAEALVAASASSPRRMPNGMKKDL